jgi:hypothetical protein
MVLDNVDTADDWFRPRATLDENGKPQRPLEVFLPQSSNGTILVTSRNSKAARNLLGKYGDPIRVEPMTESDALKLLKASVRFGETCKNDARALVSALGGIPLAITHAAAYIRMRERFNISKYLRLFRQSEANMVNLLNDDDATHDLGRDYSDRVAVVKTLQINIDQIEETTPRATDLLALMSMFNMQAIPRCLLDDSADSLQFEDAIAPLLNYSLIHQQTRKEDFGMHRIVQVATRNWLEMHQDTTRWRTEALRKMAAVFPDGKVPSWPLCQVLLPHAKELLSFGPTHGSQEDALNCATILSESGWYLTETGEYKGAEKNLREALTIRAQLLGADDEKTLKIVSSLTSLFQIQGNIDEIRPIMKWLEEVRKKTDKLTP